MAVSSPLQLSIVIHPVVIFTICDSYERRNEDIDKIHGTLLGKVEKERIEIRNCFIDDNPTASGKVRLEWIIGSNEMVVNHIINLIGFCIA